MLRVPHSISRTGTALVTFIHPKDAAIGATMLDSLDGVFEDKFYVAERDLSLPAVWLPECVFGLAVANIKKGGFPSFTDRSNWFAQQLMKLEVIDLMPESVNRVFICDSDVIWHNKNSPLLWPEGQMVPVPNDEVYRPELEPWLSRVTGLTDMPRPLWQGGHIAHQMWLTRDLHALVRQRLKYSGYDSFLLALLAFDQKERGCVVSEFELVAQLARHYGLAYDVNALWLAMSHPVQPAEYLSGVADFTVHHSYLRGSCSVRSKG